MSRLGDMIKKQRLEKGWTPKALGKKCGVSESFIKDVEAGTRIIADTEATRILKAMGKTEEVMADFEASADYMTPPQTRPAPAREQRETPPAEKNAPPSDTWISALGGLLQAVPVKNLGMELLATRTLPTQNGKILGAAPEKVFYLRQSDNSMAGYRIRKDDLLLVIPFTSLQSEGVYLLEENGEKGVYKITAQSNERLLLQQYEFEPRARVAEMKNVKLLGQIRRVEYDL